MRLRARVLALVLTGSAAILCGTPASAASVPNPCKVLKSAEIAAVLGATPAAGVRGTRELSSVSCSYAVPAVSGRPAGELIVTVTFSGAKTTYDALARDARYTAFDEGGVKGRYAPNPLGVAQVLKKSRMLTVQGVFVDTTARPVAMVEMRTQLVELASIGAKRL